MSQNEHVESVLQVSESEVKQESEDRQFPGKVIEVLQVAVILDLTSPFTDIPVANPFALETTAPVINLYKVLHRDMDWFIRINHRLLSLA